MGWKRWKFPIQCWGRRKKIIIFCEFIPWISAEYISVLSTNSGRYFELKYNPTPYVVTQNKSYGSLIEILTHTVERIRWKEGKYKRYFDILFHFMQSWRTIFTLIILYRLRYSHSHCRRPSPLWLFSSYLWFDIFISTRYLQKWWFSFMFIVFRLLLLCWFYDMKM